MCLLNTVKKGYRFSRPQPRDVTNQLSLAGNNLIIPGQGDFGYSHIPVGDGKNDNLFLQCTREADVIIQILAHVYHHHMYTHCTLLMTSMSGESKITRNKWRGERWGFHLGIMSQAPALSPSFPQSHVSDLLTPRKLWFSLSLLRTSDPITIGSFIVTNLYSLAGSL